MKRWAIFWILIGVVAAVISGCGGPEEPGRGDPDESSTSATAPATTTTVGPAAPPSSSTTTTSIPAAPEYLLPDLTPLPPQELYIRVDPRTNERELRFSSQVANLGEAPLEMRGENNDASGRTDAYQRLRTPDGQIEERMVGDFVLHPGHRHWHFEGFTRLDIVAPDASGEPGEVVASSGKITSCVRDRIRLSPPVLGSPQEPGYRNCGTELQGISVGWTDLYEAKVPGQQVSIEGLADGPYYLRLTADPENLLMESEEFNNTVTVPIRITGSKVEVIDRQ